MLLLNAGRADDHLLTPDDERSVGQQNTVPDFILPGCTLRPDILLIKGWQPPKSAFDPTTNSYDLSKIPPDSLPKPGPGITLIFADVKICRDTGVSTALTYNWAHYNELLHQIRSRGWRVLGQQPDGTINDSAEGVITLPFGCTGLNYHGTIPALQAFGVPRKHAVRLHKEATKITIAWATAIINQKRALERALTADTSPQRRHHRPPENGPSTPTAPQPSPPPPCNPP